MRETPIEGFIGASDALRGVWDDLSVPRRKAILGVLVAQVTIAPAAKGFRAFDPERVEYLWRM